MEFSNQLMITHCRQLAVNLNCKVFEGKTTNKNNNVPQLLINSLQAGNNDKITFKLTGDLNHDFGLASFCRLFPELR